MIDNIFSDWDSAGLEGVAAFGGIGDGVGDWSSDWSGDWLRAGEEEWCEDWLSAESRLICNPGGASHGLPLSVDLGVGQDSAMTFADDRGMAVYSDTTGDGCVDHLSVVGFDGSWSSWQRSTDLGTPVLLDPADISGDTVGGAEGSGPPVTPTTPMDNWSADGWECVERGQWG